MGKKLIIKGADFLNNALELGIDYTDITSLFSQWETGAYSSNTGNTTGNTSTVFVRATPVDVSEYAGRNIKYSFVAYTASNGNATGYGFAFMDSDNAFISSLAFPKNGNTAGAAKTYWATSTIPATAKYLRVTYFNSSKIAEINGLNFQILVENEEEE